jgi:signal transduction histidine kinase
VKLAGKLTLAVAAAILVVMAAYDYILVREEMTLFEVDVDRIVHPGRRLGAAMEAVWRKDGQTKAQRLLETMDSGVSDVSLGWRWLDAPPNDPRHVSLEPADLAKLRAGQIVSVFREEQPGEPERHTFVPMSVDRQPPAALELTDSLRRAHAFIATTHQRIIFTSLCILVLCTAAVMGLGFWFVGRPLRYLRDTARAIGAGELPGPLRIRQRDEIGELAFEISAMCERLSEARTQTLTATEERIAAIEQMRHTDRLTTMGQLASGVAHELGTPLNVVAGRAEMLVTGEATGAAVADNGRIILEQANLMTALIRQLLDFSRRQAPHFGIVSLRAIAAHTLDLLAAYARRRGLHAELVAGDDPVLVSADPSQIQQAITNIVMNGLQSMREGGRLTVRVGARSAKPPGDQAACEEEYACVVIEDEGAGIAPENLAHVFEPFFSTKGIGEGTGLGLSVAWGIVQEHGGWITAETEQNRGSRFTIFLKPASDAGSAVAS